jgi:hypothetical protein
VLISWPAFTTADGAAVESLSVKLGGGAFSARLALNTGAQPAGVYYKVIYQLTDDAVQAAWSREYRIESDCLPAKDVLPGDAVQEAAVAAGGFAAIVREVDVQVASAAIRSPELRDSLRQRCGRGAGVVSGRTGAGDRRRSAMSECVVVIEGEIGIKGELPRLRVSRGSNAVW